MNQEEKGKKMSQLIAKCWADEGFKKRLLADATATLKAEGAEVPAGLAYKAVENTDNLVHIVIPLKPTELSEEDLQSAVGGYTSPALYFRKWLQETTACNCAGNLLCDVFCS
jgi:hypothetical protein